VLSSHPPERLHVELQSRVGPTLSQRGYRVVGFGPAGVTWRRDMAGKIVGALCVLGFFALGGYASGDAGSIVLGVILTLSALLLFYIRRPNTVGINMTRVAGGTELTFTGGRDAAKAQELAQSVAGPAPEGALAAVPVRRAEGLTGPIAGLVRDAHLREARIREAITRADLPYDEVADEVNGFVDAIDRTARRAQLLQEALDDSPPEKVAARLAEVRDDPDQAGLAEALTTQLATLEKMQRQLKRFYSELERLLVELDTVRSQLISVSASTESEQQDELVEQVRDLRERMGAVADGMAAAYEEPPTPPSP
jgi:archaellum component FlaC